MGMMNEIRARVAVLNKQLSSEQLAQAQPELIEAFRAVLSRHLGRDTYSVAQDAELRKELVKVVDDWQTKWCLRPEITVEMLDDHGETSPEPEGG